LTEDEKQRGEEAVSEPATQRIGIAVIVLQILLLVALAIMGVKVYSSPDAGKTVYALVGQTVPATRIDDAKANPDALKLAYDVGVLEILSIGVTFFTVILALAAFLGFWMIRGAAVRAAEIAAKAEAKEQAEKTASLTARRYLEEKVPALTKNMLQTLGTTPAPEIGMTPQEVEEVISEATEMGGNQNGSE
jgi:hypothetical protein